MVSSITVLDKNLKIALAEVGEILPWYDEEVEAWIFSHANYPVEYGGDSPEEVIENYPRYLEEFIAHRLQGKLNPLTEKKTKGKAGLS